MLFCSGSLLPLKTVPKGCTVKLLLFFAGLCPISHAIYGTAGFNTQGFAVCIVSLMITASFIYPFFMVGFSINISV